MALDLNHLVKWLMAIIMYFAFPIPTESGTTTSLDTVCQA